MNICGGQVIQFRYIIALCVALSSNYACVHHDLTKAKNEWYREFSPRCDNLKVELDTVEGNESGARTAFTCARDAKMAIAQF